MSSKAEFHCFATSSCVIPPGSPHTCVKWDVLEEVPTTGELMQVLHVEGPELSQHSTEARLKSSTHRLIY